MSKRATGLILDILLWNTVKSTDSEPPAYLHTSASVPIVIDSGATFGCALFEDYLIPSDKEAINQEVKSLSSTLAATRYFGRWRLQDKNSVESVIEPFLHVVPDSEVHILAHKTIFEDLVMDLTIWIKTLLG